MLHALLLASLVWVLVLLGALAVALARARDTPRRLVLSDAAVILVVVSLALTAIRVGEAYFLDAALALALLSFVASIAVAAHAARHLEEPGGDG
jgi:multicomponent Na+:H+ antiporter subunit F